MALHSLSLCSGVGGLELGIALALHHRGETVRGICYVEREAAAAASLVASMEAGWIHPAPVWTDLATFDARPWSGLVHILASGDPCQDNSVAGRGAGSDGERFLAPEVVRIAEECRPDLIFRENVPGNADGQFAALVPALERLGYSVAAGIFSSAKTGNTMRRERLFVMAERQDIDWKVATGPERQHLSDAGGRGNGMDGTECPERRQDGQPCRASGEYALPRRQEGAVGAGTSGQALGGANDGGRPRFGGCGQGGTSEPGTAVARTSGARLQGCQSGGADARLQLPAAERGGRRLPPAVIPGPTDSRWIDVLDRWPELQPALSQEETQSHLCRGVDAMANRIERLRATGNGVDPMVAAHAFLSLSALLADGRASANGDVLMASPTQDAERAA
jgi:DNA (cytosine-5)-methyltransferase 1